MNKKEKKQVKEKTPMTKGDKISLIIGIVLCVILVPILIFNCVSILKSVITDKPPSVGNYTPLVVTSGSMEPLFSVDDVILVEKVDLDSIQEGDVISYFENGRNGKIIVTHRVVELGEEDGKKYAVTAGDWNVKNSYRIMLDSKRTEEEKAALEAQIEVFEDKNAPADENGDPYTYIVYEPANDDNRLYLDEDKVIGRYIYQEAPKQIVGFTNFMKSPWAWVCFVIIPLAALVTVEVIMKKKRDKQKSKDMDDIIAQYEALKASVAAEANKGADTNVSEPETPKDADDAPKEG